MKYSELPERLKIEIEGAVPERELLAEYRRKRAKKDLVGESLAVEKIIAGPAYDLAIDYVEHEVGMADFKHSWEKLKKTESDVSKWLAEIGEDPNQAQKVYSVLQDLAAEKKGWSTFFSRDTLPKIEPDPAE